MAEMGVVGPQQWTVEKPWLADLRCTLGEGPYYEEQTGIVRFVDIKKKRLHSVSKNDNGDGSTLHTVQLDICPTVTADIMGVHPRERILLGVKYGVAILDRSSGEYEVIAEFNQPQRNERLRSNDGAVDPHGRFWVGSMTDFGQGEFQPEGSLFRFNSAKSRTHKDEVLKNLTIPNSVGWCPDNRIMYFTHSKSREVFAFDYSSETGAVSGKRLWYQHDGPGEPDGFRVDVNGNVWHAVYGEGRVLKLNPEGEVIGQINLPTRNITCVQFVGTELVITSAAEDDGDDAAEASRGYGGAIFKVDVGTTGLTPFEFRL